MVELSVDLLQRAQRSEVFIEWSQPAISQSVERYKKFLFLIKKYPDFAFAPSIDIDEIWHLHMLSPKAYYTDCMNLFGEILDHDGGFGALEDEKEELANYFNETSQKWHDEFGENYATLNVKNHGMTKCMKACRVACKKNIDSAA